MNNKNKELFNNDVEANVSEEEIVLAPPTELFDEAKEIAQSTHSDEKFPFALQYDSNQKEFLLSMLETVGAIVEDDDDDGHVLATMMNMTQLAFIKRLDCVERVKTDECINPFISEEAVKLTPNMAINATDVVTASVEKPSDNSISVASVSASARSSSCPCPTNTDMANAREINVETLVSGCICCPGAEQWFKFVATRTGQYTICTTGNLDTIGTLYDCYGNQIIEVDNYEPCGNINFRIIQNLTAGNTYYVRVCVFGDDTGSYTLRVTERVFANYVNINKSTITLEKGVTYELPITPNYNYKGYNGAHRIPGLSVSIDPSNAEEQRIWWWEEKNGVLECSYGWDEEGDRYIHIRASKTGIAKLYAQDWNENGKRDECTVTVVTPYEKQLQDLGGFSSDETNLILKVYDKVDLMYTSENTLQKAWRCARVLSEFSYDSLTYGINSWNNVAGSVTTDVGEKGEVDRKTYFVDTLGFTTAEYDTLDDALTRNHGNREGNTNIIDFTHMQYALAARLAYSLNIDGELSNWGPDLYTGNFGRYSDEDVSYLGGWFGDAILTNISGEGQTVFANDDYMADLDAENIYRIIMQGKSSVNAINEYYSVMTSTNTRATIFLQHIPYNTVKEKVFYELIDAQLYVLMSDASCQGDIVMTKYWSNLINNEQYHFDEIKVHYPDTYNFLKNLEDRNLTMVQYA